MPWIWILAALAALLIWRGRPYRYWGFGLGAACIVVLLWAMHRSDFGGLLSPPGQGMTAPPTAPSIDTPPVDAIQGENLRLAGNGAPWEFTGRLINTSSVYKISAVSFELVRSDCYENAPTPDGCDTIWRGKRTVNVMIPPAQMRDFQTDIWLHGSTPRPRGVVRDQFKIVAVNGSRIP